MRAARERRYLVQVLSLFGLVLGLHVLRYIISTSCVPPSSTTLRIGNAAHSDESNALPGVRRQPLALQSARIAEQTFQYYVVFDFGHAARLITKHG